MKIIAKAKHITAIFSIRTTTTSISSKENQRTTKQSHRLANEWYE